LHSSASLNIELESCGQIGAVDAVREADVVVLGPGSWFTSVIPHLLLHELGKAIASTNATVVVTVNLVPQAGETDDFSPEELLRVLGEHADRHGGLFIDAIVAVMHAASHHTYQILTKRPANLARKLAALNRHLPTNVWAGATTGHPKSLPLLKPLLRVEAPVRFVSVEPLLAPMIPGFDLAGIGWVIAGGESGHDARPCDPEWMRAVRDLCVAHDVPFFLKQWGVWENNPTPRGRELDPDAKGGATLDGRLWREFP